MRAAPAPGARTVTTSPPASTQPWQPGYVAPPAELAGYPLPGATFGRRVNLFSIGVAAVSNWRGDQRPDPLGQVVTNPSHFVDAHAGRGSAA